LKVSFCLFTYNQKQFVNSAVLAALNQKYRPLEIIISDDCSTDGTFELIEELISSHEIDQELTVILNRNKVNLGIGAHVKLLSELSSGDILVIAAGDDISHVDRVSEVVDVMRQDEKIMAVFTDIRYINNDGSIDQMHPKRYRRAVYPTISDMLSGGGGVAAGASYAYKREVFFWPHRYPEMLMCEDRILPLRARLLGKVFYIDKPLVDYRLSLFGVSRAIPKKLLDVRANNLHMNEVKMTLNRAKIEGRLSNISYTVFICQLLGMRPLYSIAYHAMEINYKLGAKLLRLLDYYFAAIRIIANKIVH
tara:strand:+ start:532 stop:1452 length:921 start_codon:yes stop_codon:yes gene_type:complete